MDYSKVVYRETIAGSLVEIRQRQVEVIDRNENITYVDGLKFICIDGCKTTREQLALFLFKAGVDDLKLNG